MRYVKDKKKPPQSFIDCCHELEVWWDKWKEKFPGQTLTGIMMTHIWMEMRRADRP